MQTGEEAQLDMDSAKRSKLESGTYILYFRCLSKLQECLISVTHMSSLQRAETLLSKP